MSYRIKLILQSLFFGIIGGLICLFITEQLFQIVLVAPKFDKEIEGQIAKLNDIQSSLKSLQGFISNQKKKLQAEKTTLLDMRKEINKLEPIIEADRKTVESIFELQQEKYRGQIWKERIIAFFIGAFSSMLASLLIIWLNRKKISFDENA